MDLPDWAQALDLSPHPEGGWYRQTWRSDVTIPHSSLPSDFPSERFAATAILFLLMPGQQSAWHTVRGTEFWMYHRGSAMQLDIGGDGERPGVAAPHVVGPDLETGQHPQVLVPPRHWQRARPLGDEPSLVSCFVSPGFDFEDFALEAKP